MSANLLWLLATYDLRIHDCRASGHATHGDGTAGARAHVEPAGRDAAQWRAAAARRVGRRRMLGFG